MAYMHASLDKGTGFTLRKESGGACDMMGGDLRLWVKLERKGKTIRGYVSNDGVTWEPRGSAEIALNEEALFGLAVCSHNNSALNTAMFDHVSVE